jgi:flagellar assembly factor FliW
MVAVADPSMMLQVVGGLAGLEEYTAYRMLSLPDSPVCWLEAIDEPQIALPCADATAVVPGYTIELSDEDAAGLQLEDADEARVLLVIQHWDDPSRLSPNGAGPIVVNTRTGLARQFLVPTMGRIAM